MRRLLCAVLLLGAAVCVPTIARASSDERLTFTVGQLQDIDSLNVTVGILVIDYEIWNLIWPTLTNMAAKDFSPEPGMAECWTSSADGLTWTYKMRTGMKWSDGEPLTADDVEYTIDRANDEEWNSHVSITANLTAEVVDETTLTITTSGARPEAPLTGRVHRPQAHLREASPPTTCPTTPAEDKLGGGPFMLDEVKKGEFVRLVRNPNWYGKKPAMDEVIFRFYADDNAQFQALKSGEIDAVDEVPEQTFSTIKDGDNIAAHQRQPGRFQRTGDELGLLRFAR